MRMRTYSTAIRSAGDEVVLELEVRVEDGGVELGFAVEAVADSLPVSGGFLGHVVGYWGSSSKGHG